MLLKITRNVLGYSIAGLDLISRGKGQQRPAAEQADVDAQTANMALYQFTACPFCIKTRRAIHRLGLTIEKRNAMNNASARRELEQQGGKIKVPCLRITEAGKDDIWMYESGDIIAYLQQRFG
ncbi:glutaredoxin family protein [Bacterioplanoides pacificum]|uniref:Glutaredoxin family protein n=1 Tax=Bacterioplanoides pacificum TaxID=1171596 RepID=A0ABV7VTC7_9GAMM